VTTWLFVRSTVHFASPSQSRPERIFSALIALDGLAILALWVVSLTSGAFGGIAGLFVYQEGNFPILHIIAEVLMGTLALVSGIGLMRRKPWARGLALAALGMLGYSSINSAGWPIRNDPSLLAPMVATLTLVLLSLPVMLRGLRRSR
jgi:hypothetical protein